MSGLQWIFDPLPPSGAIQGGIPIAHVLGPDVGIDTFVREVIQNSLDQKIDGEPVRLRFGLHQLSDDSKQQLIEAIEWEQLEPHLRGVANGGSSVMARRLDQSLEDLYARPLTILRIDDSGAQGLTGGENEEGKNFNALCRNVLDTAEDRPLRGGSFGLGKAVLWRFSSLSTVLFSSRISEKNPRAGFRLFGRTELPYHLADDQRWNGPGWFGMPEHTDNGTRAVSVWDEQATPVAERCQLFRPAQLGSGTTILLLGFFEPGEEESRPVQHVAADIVNATSRWFWPSTRQAQPELQVLVEAFDNDTNIYRQHVEPGPEVAPFILAMSAPGVAHRIAEPGEVAEKQLQFKVPARRPSASDPGDPELEGTLTLRLRLAGSDDSPSLRNRVALMRGAGMVVDYRRPSRSPLEDQPYHAILLGGLAHGTSDSDYALEMFLRASEPPSHNQWMPGTDRVQAAYQRGARARLQQLWADLDHAIVELCEEEVPAATQGPERLARLFPLKGRGEGTAGRRRFRIDRLDAYLDDSAWHISGRVTKRARDDDDWNFLVSLWLDAETGMGEQIKLAHFEIDAGDVKETGDSWECELPATTNEVSFKGTSEPGIDERYGLILSKSRVRLDVRPRIRTEHR